MSRKRYPSDVTDDEWAFVAPYLTLQRLADVVTALLQARSTKHARLALHLPGPVRSSVKLRRVERCLHDP